LTTEADFQLPGFSPNHGDRTEVDMYQNRLLFVPNALIGNLRFDCEIPFKIDDLS